jgi:hypothetical protein
MGALPPIRPLSLLTTSTWRSPIATLAREIPVNPEWWHAHNAPSGSLFGALTWLL